jgi:hypothetical protein
MNKPHARCSQGEVTSPPSMKGVASYAESDQVLADYLKYSCIVRNPRFIVIYNMYMHYS